MKKLLFNLLGMIFVYCLWYPYENKDVQSITNFHKILPAILVFLLYSTAWASTKYKSRITNSKIFKLSSSTKFYLCVVMGLGTDLVLSTFGMNLFFAKLITQYVIISSVILLLVNQTDKKTNS